jgi:hypothetical protein
MLRSQLADGKKENKGLKRKLKNKVMIFALAHWPQPANPQNDTRLIIPNLSNSKYFTLHFKIQAAGPI